MVNSNYALPDGWIRQLRRSAETDTDSALALPQAPSAQKKAPLIQSGDNVKQVNRFLYKFRILEKHQDNAAASFDERDSD